MKLAASALEKQPNKTYGLACGFAKTKTAGSHGLHAATKHGRQLSEKKERDRWKGFLRNHQNSTMTSSLNAVTTNTLKDFNGGTFHHSLLFEG